MQQAIHHLLTHTAKNRPEHPFLETGKGVTTYGEFDHLSTAFAAGLIARGVVKGDRIVLALDNIAEYPIAYYGILKAGAVAVPVSSDTRQASLLHVLTHCEARAVVLADKNSRLLDGCAAQLPFLHTIYTVGKTAAGEEGVEIIGFAEVTATTVSDPLPPEASASGDDLAAIMYTSGTTAAPKGVMLSHRNILANTEATVDYLQLQPDERLGLVLPFFYSYGNSLMHTHIQVGGTLVDLGSIAFPAAVLGRIEKQRCTGFSGVPPTFARLIQFKALQDYDLSSLRYLTQAGGPMTPALTMKVREAIPHARLFIMYGQTEAAPRLTYLPAEDLECKLGSVGLPLKGVELTVRDADDNVLGPGEKGELVAKGENVMLGYWRDPGATQRVLRNSRLYTGDMAKVDKDGFFYIVGRHSDMIKAGAHRIAPQEIESVIETLPEVAECAVTGREDEMLGEAIVAFVVPVAGAEESLTDKQIMRVCFEHLPRYKFPSTIYFTQQLPRTENGKLSRAGLKDFQA